MSAASTCCTRPSCRTLSSAPCNLVPLRSAVQWLEVGGTGGHEQDPRRRLDRQRPDPAGQTVALTRHAARWWHPSASSYALLSIAGRFATTGRRACGSLSHSCPRVSACTPPRTAANAHNSLTPLPHVQASRPALRRDPAEAVHRPRLRPRRLPAAACPPHHAANRWPRVAPCCELPATGKSHCA